MPARVLTRLQEDKSLRVARLGAGATRLCLLASFVIFAITTYLYLDTYTIQRFLLKVCSGVVWCVCAGLRACR